MEHYIIKSFFCLAVLLTFYKLFLEQQHNHNFKRWYLISSVLLSLGIPILTFTTVVGKTISSIEQTAVNLPINHGVYQLTDSVTASSNTTNTLLWIVYAVGVGVMSFRFFKNLISLIKTIKSNTIKTIKPYTYVLVNKQVTPHTFLRFIFLNKTAYNDKTLAKEIILHEQAHVKQLHSIDIIYIEMLHIIFWFNPLFYVIKKAIKLNHEFLADRAVLDQGADTFNYKKIILEASSPSNNSILSNAFNYSSIKKRFTVMKTKTSRQVLWFKNLALLLLLTVLTYGFSNKKEVVELKYDTVLPKKGPNQNTDTTLTSDDLERQQNIIEIYNKALSDYNEQINKKPHFVKRNKKEQEKMNNAYKKVAAIYDDQLTPEQQHKLSKPSLPYEPYVKLTNLDGRVYYKLTEDLTEDDNINLQSTTPPSPPSPRLPVPTPPSLESPQSIPKQHLVSSIHYSNKTIKDTLTAKVTSTNIRFENLKELVDFNFKEHFNSIFESNKANDSVSVTVAYAPKKGASSNNDQETAITAYKVEYLGTKSGINDFSKLLIKYVKKAHGNQIDTNQNTSKVNSESKTDGSTKGFVYTKNLETLYFSTVKNETEYYNRWGAKVSKPADSLIINIKKHK